jgi:Mg2+-importing ATPase
LLATTLLIVGLTLCLPFTPLAAPFGFKPLPSSVLLIIGAIVGLYILMAETIKKIFYKKVKF